MTGSKHCVGDMLTYCNLILGGRPTKNTSSLLNSNVYNLRNTPSKLRPGLAILYSSQFKCLESKVPGEIC